MAPLHLDVCAVLPSSSSSRRSTSSTSSSVGLDALLDAEPLFSRLRLFAFAIMFADKEEMLIFPDTIVLAIKQRRKGSNKERGKDQQEKGIKKGG